MTKEEWSGVTVDWPPKLQPIILIGLFRLKQAGEYPKREFSFYAGKILQPNLFSLLKFMYIFWEGNNILQNLHRRFDRCYIYRTNCNIVITLGCALVLGFVDDPWRMFTCNVGRNVVCNVGQIVVWTGTPLDHEYPSPRIPHFKVIPDESISPSDAFRTIRGD